MAEPLDFVDEFEKKTIQESVEQFNAHRFFEAHETLEPVWLKSDLAQASFIRGLVRTALAFRNLQTKNFSGARYLVEAATQDLTPYDAQWAKGINITELLKELKSSGVLIEEIERTGGDWDFDQTPKISWEPAPHEEAAA